MTNSLNDRLGPHDKLQLNTTSSNKTSLPVCIRVRKSVVAVASIMSEHAILYEVMVHSGSHLRGVREHGGGHCVR